MNAAFQALCARLAVAGVPDARFDAAELYRFVTRRDPRLDDGPTEAEAARLAALADRRAAREPLQYILGEWDFMDFSLKVGPGVLCPRADSEVVCEAAIELLLEQYKIDVIVLAGFLSILSENFTKKWPRRILNIHPSLIPSFCGRGMYGLKVHEAALARGVKVTGATVHFVNEIPDGGEIILQKAVEIEEGDTPETLQRRVMEQAEWKLLPRATELVCRAITEEEN